MSQLASFTYLKESHVPFLGLWSKPKPRLFRKPECKFPELLKQHTLRECTFAASDGIYVAFVLAWMELQEPKLARFINPVIGSMMKHIGGSHWILKFGDHRLAPLVEKQLPENEWPSFLRKMDEGTENEFEWDSFEAARSFVLARLLELQVGEALLVSVG